ncbi:MAG: glycosyltransferase, partial [Thermomicrobiales bacterium]
SLDAGVPLRRLWIGGSGDIDPFVASWDNPTTAQALEAALHEFQPDVLHLFSGYLMSASVMRVAQKHHVPVVVSLTDYWWLCHRITLIRTDGSRCDGPSPAGCARCHAEARRRFRAPAAVAPALADAGWSTAVQWPTLGKRLGLPQQVDRSTALRALLATADTLIAPSQFLADTYARHGFGAGSIVVSRQGVDIDRCPVRGPSDELRVGYLGQVKPHKGVDLLLTAWGQLKGDRPRRLTLFGSSAGEPDYGERVRRMCDALPGVGWAGEFKGTAVWEVLAGLDVVVVPSRWIENSPNVILEAQAVGVPVIGSQLGGVAELVRHGVNGLTFEVDDTFDLTLQLQRLLDEPDLLTTLRDHPIPFRTVDDELEQLRVVYEESVARRRQDAVCQPVSIGSSPGHLPRRSRVASG